MEGPKIHRETAGTWASHLESAAIRAGGERIDARHLPPEVRGGAGDDEPLFARYRL